MGQEGDITIPDVDLVQSDGPQNPSSADWLVNTVPWSQHLLRNVGQNPASRLSVAETIFHDNGAGTNARRGGRRGPLSRGGRENAAGVRDNGACLRCFIMKEQVGAELKSRKKGTDRPVRHTAILQTMRGSSRFCSLLQPWVRSCKAQTSLAPYVTRYEHHLMP